MFPPDDLRLFDWTFVEYPARIRPDQPPPSPEMQNLFQEMFLELFKPKEKPPA